MSGVGGFANWARQPCGPRRAAGCQGVLVEVWRRSEGLLWARGHVGGLWELPGSICGGSWDRAGRTGG